MSTLQINFTNPNQKIDGENKSKLLSPDCSLFKYIIEIRNILSNNEFIFDVRPPHIELYSSSPNEDDKLEYKNRINQLENTFTNSNVYMLTDKALVIYTGIVNFYGPTHATIAYFKEGLTIEQFEIVKRCIANCSTQEDINKFKTIQSSVINKQCQQQTNGRRSQDWWCEKCQFKIFGSKSECFKCKTKRPTENSSN